MKTLIAIWNLDWPRMVKHLSMFATIQTGLLLTIAGLGMPKTNEDGGLGFFRLTFSWLGLSIVLFLAGLTLYRLGRPWLTWTAAPPLVLTAITILFSQITDNDLTSQAAIFLCALLTPPFLWAAISPYTPAEQREMAAAETSLDVAAQAASERP